MKVLGILSGKGGAGKTTISMNLALALINNNKDVILIDADLDMPNLGLYLGVAKAEATIHDVLKGKKEITDAIFLHRSGLKIVLGDISSKNIPKNSGEKLKLIMKDLNLKTEVAMLDMGSYDENVIKAIDYAIIVTNPELPAIADSLRVITKLQSEGKEVLGCIINKAGNVLDVGIENAETMLGVPVLAIIPEEKEMKEAVRLKHPVFYSHPEAESSEIFNILARNLVNSQ